MIWTFSFDALNFFFWCFDALNFFFWCFELWTVSNISSQIHTDWPSSLRNKGVYFVKRDKVSHLCHLCYLCHLCQSLSIFSIDNIWCGIHHHHHHLCHRESGADPPPWRGVEQQGDERGASQLSHLRRRPPQCARFALPLLLLSKRKIVFYWTQLLLMPVVSLLLFCVALRALLRVGGGGDCAPLQEREQHLQVPKVSRRRHQKTGAWTEKNGRRKI